jgi:hypothetical protein
MTTLLRLAVLIAAALLVAGVVWGLVGWQGDLAAGLQSGDRGPASGERGGGGLGGGFGRSGREAGGAERALAEGEGHGHGEGPGRGRGESEYSGAAGWDELGHNLAVIGAIGAVVIAVSLAADALRRFAARRRTSSAA